MTNVLISGMFFGVLGRISKRIPGSVVGQKITACAAAEIIDEYEELVQEMNNRITFWP